MNSISEASAKHQPKGRDSRIIQAAIVKILQATPGTSRLVIADGLSQAFDSSLVHAQMRTMIESGEMIEQSERVFGPRCYLKDQPRPAGQVLQIRSATVTSYFDTSISAPTPKPPAQVRRERMQSDGPLLDRPRRRRGGTTVEARAKGRVTAINGKITTCNQTIANLQKQRSQIIQSGGKKVDSAPDERIRQIYTDRLASDLRHIDRCLQDAQTKLQRQLDLKASIEGGAS
jgi:hypothetical protein